MVKRRVFFLRFRTLKNTKGTTKLTDITIFDHRFDEGKQKVGLKRDAEFK